MVTPARLEDEVVNKMLDISLTLARELEIRGPFNIQFLVKNNDPYVIELNLRASRSMPFSSKSRNVNLMELSAKVVVEGTLGLGEGVYVPPTKVWGVKSPQFSWTQLKGAYPDLGPEMRSTGEVAAFSRSYEDALILSWLSAVPNDIPNKDKKVLVYSLEVFDEDRTKAKEAADAMSELGYHVITLEGVEVKGYEPYDSSKIKEMLVKREIGLVITSGSNRSVDYVVRRTAVDMNVPLVLNSYLGAELSKAFIKVYEKYGALDPARLEIKEYGELLGS